MTASTDNQRIAELNSKVSSGYSGPPTDTQNAVDLALGRLSANNEILGVKVQHAALQHAH
jgi:hypothetical protein